MDLFCVELRDDTIRSIAAPATLVSGSLCRKDTSCSAAFDAHKMPNFIETPYGEFDRKTGFLQRL